VENLISKVSEAKKTPLYNDMCGLLESLTEEDFNTKYEDFKLKYVDEKSVHVCSYRLGRVGVYMARYVAPVQPIIPTWLYEHYESCGEVMALHQIYFITKKSQSET